MKVLDVLTKIVQEMVSDLTNRYPYYAVMMEPEDLKQEICFRALSRNIQEIDSSEWSVFYTDVLDDMLEYLRLEYDRAKIRERISTYASIMCSCHAESAEVIVIRKISEG